MRWLIYVPIIHTEADAGELAGGIEEQAEAVVGGDNWQKHKEVVRRYWQAIADYWEGKNVADFKIFQDGLPVDGEVGENIVKSLAEKGSINHMIVMRLMQQGAQLVKTEDPELVKEEYVLTRELIEKKSSPGKFTALFRYRQRKDRLLRARDRYMVKRINESLVEGETGICFLGAYHQVWSSLPKDIAVITLKDPQKVKEYYQKFTSNRWEKELDTLRSYLTAPIIIETGKNDE
jgi:hypothetical protein